MRITGGDCRGRTIKGPEGLAVRPTSSKIRQAFFNILNNIVPEGRFVDVCAGSGLMGMEALSRGASSLIAIEEDRTFAKAIEADLKRFGFQSSSEVICGNLKKVLPLLAEKEADVIFADPPYKSELATRVLELVEKHQLLSDDGVLAIEHPNDLRLPETFESLEQYDRRKYGQTAISFFRRV